MIYLGRVMEVELGITTNAIAMFLLCISFASCLRLITIKNKRNFSFYLMFLVSFIEIIVHLITTVIQYYNFFNINGLGIFLYSFVYIVNCFYFIAWIIYLSQRLKSKTLVQDSYKKIFLFSIPVFILLILSIINMFIPVFFSFINFEYKRMPLYILTLIIPLCYLALGLISFMKSNRKKRVYLEIPFIELLIPIIIAHILETHINGLCIIPLGNVITLIILVFNNMQQNISVDKLTGLYTRKELYDFLESNINNNRKYISGVMMDLDDFKMINDNYGHLVGDDALMDFGNILRKSLPSNAIGFRYSGDEFIIIIKTNDTNEINSMIDEILDNIEKNNITINKQYKIEVSFGIATYKDDETIKSFINRMDYEMYQDKIKKKRI